MNNTAFKIIVIGLLSTTLNCRAQVSIEAWFSQAFTDVQQSLKDVESTYHYVSNQIEQSTQTFVNEVTTFANDLKTGIQNYNCATENSKAMMDMLDQLAPNGSFVDIGIANKYVGDAAIKCKTCFSAALTRMFCRIPETVQGNLAFMDKMQSAMNHPALKNIPETLKPVAVICMNLAEGFTDEFMFYVQAAEEISKHAGSANITLDPSLLYSKTACEAYGDEAFDALLGNFKDAIDKNAKKEKAKRRYKVISKILGGYSNMETISGYNAKIDQLMSFMPQRLEDKIKPSNPLLSTGTQENVFLNATGNKLWTDARNWSNQRIPFSYEIAYIPAGKEVIVDRPVSVRDIINANISTSSIAPYDGLVVYIQSKATGLYWDVAAGSKTDGGNIHQWGFHGGENQKFKFQYAGNGFYTITNLNSGLNVDVFGPSTKNGANVGQWTESGWDNQLFKLEDTGDGHFFIKSKHSSTHMEVDPNGSGNGANIQQWAWHGQDRQQFKLIIAGGIRGEHHINYTKNTPYYHGHKFYLQPKHSNMVLSVFGNSTVNGGNLLQWDNNRHISQQFIFEDTKDGDGSYYIKCVMSGLYIDVYGASKENGANINQWGLAHQDNQKFYLDDAGSGYINIRAKHSNLLLDIEGTNPNRGVNLQQWELIPGDNSQKFKLIPANLSGQVFIIEHKHSGKVLDVEGPSNQNGNRLHLWERHNGENQKFLFQLADIDQYHDEWYYLINLNSHKYVDVQGFSKENNAVVHQTDDVKYNDWNKMFRLVRVDDNYYYIQGRFGGKYFKIENCQTNLGSKLKMNDLTSGSDCQMFKLIQIK